ncbi:MAG: alpha/beta fold hydrolase [Caulobacterales bacterium]
MERHLAVDSFAAPLLDESTGQSTVGWHPRMQLVEDARIETSLPVSEWPALQVRGNRGAMIALHTDHLRRNTTVRVTSPDEHNWKIDCRNPQVGRHQRPGPHSGITILEEAAVPLPPVTLAAVTPEGAHTVAGVLLSPLDGDRELVIIVVGGPGAQATRQIGGTLEADLLRAGFAVLIVDYGGSAGATPLGANGLRLRGPTGLAEDAGALAQLSQGIAQHYGYGQTHILADSFGALMAQELAQQLEGSLSSMVLLVPWTHYRDPSEWVDPLGRNPEALSPGQKARVMEARAHEVAVFGSRINNPSSPWNAYFSGLYQDCSAFPPTLFVLAEIDPKSQPADLTSCLRTGNATVSVVPRVTHELVVAPAETREMIISFLRR